MGREGKLLIQCNSKATHNRGTDEMADDEYTKLFKPNENYRVKLVLMCVTTFHSFVSSCTMGEFPIVAVLNIAYRLKVVLSTNLVGLN